MPRYGTLQIDILLLLLCVAIKSDQNNCKSKYVIISKSLELHSNVKNALKGNQTHLDRHQKAIKDSHAEKKCLGREFKLFIQVSHPCDNTLPQL